MDNVFKTLLDELLIDVSSIDPYTITKKEFDKKSLTIKQKIKYLLNTKVSKEYKNACESSLQTILQMFEKKCKEFKIVEEKMKESRRLQAERTIRGVSPNISNDDMKIALKNPSEYTKQKILSNEPDSVILNKLKYVEEKYQDILDLEANIAELNQMFQYFGMLVEQQGGTLDRVKLQIKNADDYVNDGNKHMKDAIEEARKLCIKRMCLCGICTTLIIIIILIIIFTVYIRQIN